MLEVENVSKSYGPTQALDRVSLTVQHGEVLGLAGPNGAGKSTLVRLIAGEEVPDTGGISIDGRQVLPGGLDLRVAVVHQEPELFQNLTVAENLVADRIPAGIRRPRVSQREMAALEELDISSYADRLLGSVPLSVRQKTEIARAVARDARVFLFDEPNSALTEHESEQLFERIRHLASQSKIVIFVTHRLAELSALADNVVVVRDGVIASRFERPIAPDLVARELVTDKTVSHESNSEPSDAGVILSLHNWTSTAGFFRVGRFDVHAGEIVGIAGVEGSGGREFVQSLAGIHEASGDLLVYGTLPSKDGGQTTYLVADRKENLFYNLSVEDNLVMRLSPPEVSLGGWWLRRARIQERAKQLSEDYGILVNAVDQQLETLSGGNQQKVALAGILASEPLVVAIEEPTRGVDVGSKAAIYRVLRSFVRKHKGCVLFCTEASEIFEVTDWVQVMRHGRLGEKRSIRTFASVESLSEFISIAEEGH